MTRFPPPARITDAVNHSIDSACAKIEKALLHPKWGDAFLYGLTGLLALLYVLYYFNITKNPYLGIEYNPSFFEMRYFWILPTLTPVLLLIGAVKNLLKLSSEMVFLGVFVVLAVVLPHFIANSSMHVFPQLTTLTLVFVIFIHLLLLLVTRKLGLGARTILFCLLEYFITLFLQRQFSESSFTTTFWLLQPYRYVFIFTLLAGHELLSKEKISFTWDKVSFICNPTNFITPLPIPFNRWKIDPSQRAKLQARALVFLSIVLLMLLSYAGIHYKLSRFLRHSHLPWVRWFVGGVWEYLYYFAFSYSNITLPIALLWWFGFNLPDAYNVPLLATTPQDRWRRWNTYFYNWYFQYVFFPIYKLTRSSFTAVMAAFGVTMYIHLAERLPQLYLILTGADEDIGLKTYKRIFFFLFHGLLVYAGIKFEKYIPSGKSRNGWFAVAAMFVIMSLLHGIFVR